MTNKKVIYAQTLKQKLICEFNTKCITTYDWYVIDENDTKIGIDFMMHDDEWYFNHQQGIFAVDRDIMDKINELSTTAHRIKE